MSFLGILTSTISPVAFSLELFTAIGDFNPLIEIILFLVSKSIFDLMLFLAKELNILKELRHLG